MSKQVKILLIGCGRVAEHYKAVFKKIKNKNFIISAVCDLNTNKLKKFQKYYKCNSYKNHKEAMLSQVFDLAIILTPSGSHYTISHDCINMRVNTITEKPMSMKKKECDILIKLAKSKKVLFGCVFQNRFNPSILFIKGLIDKGYFGKIITANIRLRWARYQEYYNDGWHGTWKNDGGVINQQCIHHIDILNMINGPVDKVCSLGENLLNNLEAEDSMVALFKFKNKSLGTLEATTAARPKDIEASLSVVAENGYFDISGIALNKITDIYIKGKKFDLNLIKRKYSQDVPNGYGLGHIPFFEKVFMNIINKKLTPPVDVLSSRDTTHLIHALYKSSETKKWIKVDNKAISSKLGN
jgi:UDP-N-acetyl-2-amino-2-deoxyglucuronate dehydrogenase